MKYAETLLLLMIVTIFSCRPAPAPDSTEHAVEMKSPDERFMQLFVDVQTARVFPDGKTFVDCTPKFSTEEILARYEQAKGSSEFNLRDFVLENFELPHQYASGFTSDTSRSAPEHINALWSVLTREPDPSDTRGTLIPLPHPYIVPGGRFGEIYYWDSYFTMQGLQTAGKADMIENMIDNFSYLLDTIGFIPNGNRTYFLSRSQPPFYAAMINLLAEMKGDQTYAKYLPFLEKEYAFWMDGSELLGENASTHRRLVRLPDGSILNRYWDDREAPRPEMYADDVETARHSQRPANEVYRHLRAAAESGWDFSSRWLQDENTLSTIHTTEIIPVDLNALLFNLEKTLEKAHRLGGKDEEADNFADKAERRRQAVEKYCWSPETGFFMDYDFQAGRRTNVPSLAGMYPLYFGLATKEQAAAAAEVIERDFLKAGGVTSTLLLTGQQWDAPNGWAPLQWITIKGLRNYGIDELAAAIRERWIALNVKVYRNTGKMVEKYNVLDMSLEAGGGEYPVQDGFGWTNGVLLRLMSE